MYQVVVGGMVNCPKESFELAGIPMHQDEVCDHVLNNLRILRLGRKMGDAFAYNERANNN